MSNLFIGGSRDGERMYIPESCGQLCRLVKSDSKVNLSSSAYLPNGQFSLCVSGEIENYVKVNLSDSLHVWALENLTWGEIMNKLTSNYLKSDE